jgi:hypothetical protein
MTDGRLGNIAREALVTDTGQAKLAGIAREALIAGVGLAGRLGTQARAQGAVTTITAGLILAGRIGARSSARGTLSIVSTGVVLGGRIAASSKARLGPATLTEGLRGTITTRSAATAWLPADVSLAGQIKTQSSGRVLQRGTVLVSARSTVQSKARGSVFVSAAIRGQWGVTVNSG